MPRKAPQKCYKCAALAIEQVHQLHGTPKTDPENFLRDSNVQSDGCYDLKLCPPKRSRLRNAEVNRQKQAIEQQARLEQVAINAPDLDRAYAVLTVYREAGYDSPIHAISGSVWKGNQQIVQITPIHTEGMTPTVLEAYVDRMVLMLSQRYGIRKFSARIRLDPLCCLIRPCFHHAEGVA
ncbi:hypothetical protein LEP3755_64350 (plasmid) [Leptolyngbya sp. NIES-3755]|nr:hypothetical protein LEP3755_64350 [Leptolyngbya sp. NIES-3755]